MTDLTLPIKQAVTTEAIGIEIDNTWPGNPNNNFETAGAAIEGTSLTGIGVRGQSAGKLAISAGVYGLNTSDGPGLVGISNGNGYGVSATSEGAKGIGVYGKGAQYAGQFDGNVTANGNLTVTVSSGQVVVAPPSSPNESTLTVIVSTGRAIAATTGDPNNDCIAGTSPAAGHAGVSATNTGTGYGLWASSPKGCAVYGQSSNVAGQFNGQVNVVGNCHVTGTQTVDVDIVLSNSDCAEDFAVDPSADASPGTVLVLDDAGVLTPSSSAYDSRVGGVVSGAGAFRPGIVLGRKAGGGRTAPIALVGKTYCKVDADYGLIAVGDLLTTSPTPGHAMKAADPTRAFGAVIGKALASLRTGKGLIPILVALQ
jgi:hypothetical protein